MEKEALREFVMMQAINVLCQLKLTYADIRKFLQVSPELIKIYMSNPDIRELLEAKNDKLVISSAIYIQYLVREADMRRQMVDVLIHIYEKCNQDDATGRKYSQQRRVLISRSNVRLVISENENLTKADEQEIYRYYDAINNMSTASDNPFFWLQFAITTLNLGQYLLAETYFGNAYANVDKMSDFDTYQLDTHYARLILEKEIYTNHNDKVTALAQFQIAHQKLMGIHDRGARVKYVLRQTSLYHDFYITYKNIMDDDEKHQFMDRASEMIVRYETYFREKEVTEIPYDMEAAYRKYRSLFDGTPYILMLRNCDSLYNAKAMSFLTTE
jgi:hypothetical protein